MRRRFINYNKIETPDLPDNPTFDYSDYLTIEVLSDNLTISSRTHRFIYSINGGDWLMMSSAELSRIIYASKGDFVSLKYVLAEGESFSSTSLVIDGIFNLMGNCLSIIFGDNAKNKKDISMYPSVFKSIFSSMNVINIGKNFLPATTLADHCYDSMFENCVNLVTTPELPATTLTSNCYDSMFENCTSLTTAPALPATTLADHCYYSMFYGCTSLTTAPELPATTLASYCYVSMFSSCTSLTTAPALPATKLANNCYNRMFSGCTKLNYIKALFTTSPGISLTEGWVNGVASTGTFVKNKNATWNATGTSGIPSGWTIQKV